MDLLLCDTVLRKRAKPVPTPPSENTCQAVAGMLALVRRLGGVGLAAPQVGLSLQLFVMGGLVYVNPMIRWLSAGHDEQREGCLSLPGEVVVVRRAVMVDLEAVIGDPIGGAGIKWRPKCLTRFVGMPARIVQHEVDHLEGKLITDRAK